MATILASNFLANTLSGTVSVINGFANIILPTLPFALEGDKPFVIKLRKGSIQGDVLSTSPVITLKDNSSIVSLTSNVSTLSEGNLVSFTLVTANAASGANIFYSVLPVTANVTVSDFFGGNTGLVTINNNQAVFALYANTDAGYIDETGEIFNLQLRTVSPQGNTVYTTSNVTILDAYKLYNVLGFTESASIIAEGSAVTLTFTGHNIPPGTTLYYSTEGNATSSLFTTGNTGSFIMNATSNTFTLTTTSTVPGGETRSFAVKLRGGSPTGTLYATSNTITVVDSSLAYMSATGGTIIDSGGYRIHAFTTSGNITVTSLGAGPAYNTIDYLAVAGGAGGGGGGGTFSSQYTGGGGGGAGGLLTSNITFTSTGTTTIAIGAGGAGSTGYGDNTPGKSGGNTIISIGGGTTLTAFGGGGGQGGDINIPAGSGNGYGRPGGSGGGTAKVNAYGPSTAGTGIAGQGNPGGVSSPVTAGGVAEDRAGGGGGGAGEAGSWKSGDPTSAPNSTQSGGIGRSINWVPASYGTPGPAPGRYFAGGGGGGGHPAGSAYIMSGGAGGGGAGGYYSPGYPTSAYLSGAVINAQDSGANATINTGGGGGGVGNAGASTGYGRSGIGGSGIVLIRYPYVPPPSFGNVTTTSSGFVEGSNITFTINATNANAYTYYYLTVGNVTASDFVGGNTGSFTANATGAVLTLQSNTSIPSNQTRYFALQIREDSLTGALKATSSNITIGDTSLAYIRASGGTELIENGYRTHIFTTSGIFTLEAGSVLSLNNTANILIVGGGGGGGGSDPTRGPGGSHGGGGGAGGVLTGAVSLAANTYTVVVGAGRQGNPNSISPATFGLNANITQTTSLGAISVIGGGGGSSNGTPAATGGPGGTGGSGGGGAASSGVPGSGGTGSVSPSNGLTGYGNPGSAAVYGSSSGGGGGATEAGAVGPAPTATAGIGGAGIGLPWVPSSYGTPGPSPTSRYFAGGGAGVSYNTAGTAGVGGGGGAATNGSQNTGGGAGGSAPQIAASPTGTIGGSGIVIIRYPYN